MRVPLCRAQHHAGTLPTAADAARSAPASGSGAEMSLDTGLVHNMSARPRTPVTCTVRPLRHTWVAFTLPRGIRLDSAQRQRLETVWRQLNFTGAALVQLAGTPPDGVTVRPCTDIDLAANVVLRTRGTLLLAEMPLIDSTEGLEGCTVASSDPRLVSWVGVTP